nr:MAG TPA: SurA N-terminal domain [Caudoviricetes sp.]
MKTNKNMLLIAIIFFLLSLCLFIKGCNYKAYEYIDMENKRGLAKKCYMTDDGLFCKVNDKNISVKQYGRR